MVSYKALNTTIESTIANARHTAWNRHGGQAAATGESPIPNARHTAWNRHGGQAAATIESITTNARHAVGGPIIVHLLRDYYIARVLIRVLCYFGNLNSLIEQVVIDAVNLYRVCHSRQGQQGEEEQKE